MSYANINLVDFVEMVLGQKIPSAERELLLACKENLMFHRTMTVGKETTSRLNVALGQLILQTDTNGCLTSLHRERTTGSQYKCVVRPLKQPNTTKIVVITNLDQTKRTGSGVWIWDYTTN